MSIRLFPGCTKQRYRVAQRSHKGCTGTVGADNLFDSYQRDLDSGIERDAGYIYGSVRPHTLFVGLKIALGD